MDKVLVTGASGYIALHCILELLKNGFAVRGSLRTPSRETQVRDAIAAEIDAKNNLEFCQLDLLKDEGWEEAMIGCKYVLHIASPFPFNEPKDENDLIVPAREGTLRALKAAKKNRVKRVVLTSSVAAIAYGHGTYDNRLGADDWTDINGPGITPYIKSKTIAEKAAWDFINNQEGDLLEMSVINPAFVMGPSLSNDIEGTSTDTFVKLLTNQIPACPNVYFNYVDVRDVARNHVAAMTNKDANGKRFPCTSNESVHMVEFAKILNKNGYPKVTTKTLPDIVVKFLALFSSEMKSIKSFLNKKTLLDNSQTKEVLLWQPIPMEQTVIEMGQSVKNYLNQRKK